jgi:hypothetical protein
VEFLPFHAELAAQVRVYDNPSLRIHFDVGPQIRGIKGDVVGCVRVLLERVKKLLIYAPLRDRVKLSYAAVKARQKQLTLRQQFEELDEVGWKFESGLIIEACRIPSTGKFDPRYSR